MKKRVDKNKRVIYTEQQPNTKKKLWDAKIPPASEQRDGEQDDDEESTVSMQNFELEQIPANPSKPISGPSRMFEMEQTSMAACDSVEQEVIPAPFPIVADGDDDDSNAHVLGASEDPVNDGAQKMGIEEAKGGDSVSERRLSASLAALLGEMGLPAECTALLVAGGVETIEDVQGLSEVELKTKFGLKLMHAKELAKTAEALAAGGGRNLLHKLVEVDMLLENISQNEP